MRKRIQTTINVMIILTTLVNCYIAYKCYLLRKETEALAADTIRMADEIQRRQQGR